MYGGDYSRKKNLVDYGFRLPSALDNRPLNFGEFEQHIDLHAEDRTEQVSLFLNEAGNILLDDSDGARVGKNVAEGAFGRDSHSDSSFLI